MFTRLYKAKLCINMCTIDIAVFGLVMSLIPEDELLIMAESTLNTKIEPYQFEPMIVACYSDEDSDLDESDTDVRE